MTSAGGSLELGGGFLVETTCMGRGVGSFLSGDPSRDVAPCPIMMSQKAYVTYDPGLSMQISLRGVWLSDRMGTTRE
jgi:hypothetical protein